MTKEGIVKALRACGRNDCDNCPCYGFLGNAACRRKNLDAADLIEAQAAEIEKLKAQVPRWIPAEERLPESEGHALDAAAGGGEVNKTVMFSSKN